MVNAMPENRRKEPDFGVRLGDFGDKSCGVKPRLTAGRLPSELRVAYRGQHL